MATDLAKKSLVEYKDPEPAATNAKSKSSNKKPNQISDVLNAILPPVEYRAEDGLKLLQKVSTTPSSREDVINLQMMLDKELQERQAREFDICPVREELYAQCFDELIRQITLECPERGLLTLRVRDEVRMTIAAYQTLYQSSITFGMRKTLQAEQGNGALLSRIDELTKEKQRLQSLLQDRRGQLDAIDKRILEKKQIEDKRMQDEKDFLDHQAAHLEKFTADTNKS